MVHLHPATRHTFAEVPTSAKKKAAAELAARYNQMIGIGTRLERLDRAVGENERRAHDLTARAQTHTVRYERASLLLTSNLPFNEWGQVFQGERMTGLCWTG